VAKLGFVEGNGAGVEKREEMFELTSLYANGGVRIRIESTNLRADLELSL
jgi:hypothetical protein